MVKWLVGLVFMLPGISVISLLMSVWLLSMNIFQVFILMVQKGCDCTHLSILVTDSQNCTQPRLSPSTEAGKMMSCQHTATSATSGFLSFIKAMKMSNCPKFNQGHLFQPPLRYLPDCSCCNPKWCPKGDHLPYALLQVKYRRVRQCWSTLEPAGLAWQPFSWWDWQRLFPLWQQALRRNWKQQQTLEQLQGLTTRMKTSVKRSWSSHKVKTSLWKSERTSQYMDTQFQLSFGEGTDNSVSTTWYPVQPRKGLSLV